MIAWPDFAVQDGFPESEQQEYDDSQHHAPPVRWATLTEGYLNLVAKRGVV